MRTPEVAERQRQRMRKYTDEELLQALVEQAQALGRTPTKREAQHNGGTYANRWGSYNAAVLAAGLTPNVVLPDRYFENDREKVPLSLRFAILHRDRFTCQYCGGTPQQGYVLHVDHKVPRSKGGKAEPDNLVTACLLCNNGKSDSEHKGR